MPGGYVGDGWRVIFSWSNEVAVNEICVVRALEYRVFFSQMYVGRIVSNSRSDQSTYIST